MQFYAVFTLCTFCLASAVITKADDDTHPIENVIKLLQGLSAKVEMESKSEELTYEKFEYWCRNSKKTLNDAISDSEEKVDVLTDSVSEKSIRITELNESIAEINDEVLRLDTSAAAALKMRTARNDFFKHNEQDFADTIKALEDAIAALEDAEKKTDGLFLAQKQVLKTIPFIESLVTDDQKSLLSTFVEPVAPGTPPADEKDRPEQLAKGDEKKHVKDYAFKSRSVIELLKGLLQDFEAQKLAATKGETNSLNQYDLAKTAGDNERTAFVTSKGQKSKELGDVKADKAKAEGDLKEANDDLKADKDTLKRTNTMCSKKANEWADRQESRRLEKEAIKAAIEILSEVTGVRSKTPTNPVPPVSPLKTESDPIGDVFLQIFDPKMKAVQLLRATAHSTHSKTLERLAQEIEAHLSGPFDQVNNMIEKLIFHLEQEQIDEDNHKNWCDLELNKTDVTIDNKEVKSLELKAAIEDATQTIKQLTQEIKENTQMVQKIVSHMKESTEIRGIGRKENADAVKDAQDAQTALANAVAVIETHYKESGMIEKKAWEFMQQNDPGVELPAEPALWNSKYTGLTDPQGQPSGIITTLQKVSADFAKMEANTNVQEEQDQSAYQDDMDACKIEKAERLESTEVKGREKKRLINKAATLEAQKKTVEKELEAVNQYLKDLQPACVDGDSTYEDRKAARAQETAALREAKGILVKAFEKGKNETNSSLLSVPNRNFLHRRQDTGSLVPR